MKTKPAWDDHHMEVIMGKLLRIGVFLAASIVALGGILFFIQHRSMNKNFSVFAGEPQRLKDIPDIVNGVLHFHSLAIIQFGLLLLIATPIARVFFSLAGFIREKDRIYMVVTSVVLLVLLYSLFGHQIF